MHHIPRSPPTAPVSPDALMAMSAAQRASQYERQFDDPSNFRHHLFACLGIKYKGANCVGVFCDYQPDAASVNQAVAELEQLGWCVLSNGESFVLFDAQLFRLETFASDFNEQDVELVIDLFQQAGWNVDLNRTTHSGVIICQRAH